MPFLCRAVEAIEAIRRTGNLMVGVPDYETALRQNAPAYGRFFHAMLDQGVSLPPSAFEAWFVTAAHDDEVIGRIVEALPAAARAAAG